ncbi:MAG: ATPase P [Planctomycetota bacterium]|nr:MAG: ATPase P [Planctomycetota bacterium]
MPPGVRHPEFCCPGCEQVWLLLKGDGLERFYELGGAEGRPIGAAPRPGSFDWLPELEEKAGGDSGPLRLVLDVQGIHCAACVWVLQELWRRRPGTLKMELNPSLGRAVLSYDPRELDLREYLREVEALGYRWAPASGERRSRSRGLLIRLGICASLSMNAMIFAMSFYFGLGADEPEIEQLFRLLAFGLCSLAVLIGGPVFFMAAWAGLKQHVLHLDLPIAIGILLAYLGSAYFFFTKGSHSYFDTVTIFVTLMLLGRFLQERAIARNRDLLLANDGTEHLRVRRFRGEELERVRIEEIEAGDALWLAPGELVSAKALLIHEARPFSLEWISGESELRMLQPGDIVPAGAFLAGNAPVRVDALETAKESGLIELLRGEEGGDGSALISGFWARLNRVYVQLVLVMAALGGLLWAWLDPSQVVDVVVSILIVTCPCALGIAIPLAFDLALASLRRRGIFVRDASLLEKALGWKRVFFDKTGTLTWGGLRASSEDALEERQRQVLLSMVQSSAHPVSEAIAELPQLAGLPFLRQLHVEEYVGEGLQARLGEDCWRLGRGRFALGGEEEAPGTYFSENGVQLACFQVQEDFRPGFAEEFEELQSSGIEVHLLSGDRQAKVAAAAARLGLPADRVRAELSPEEKAEYLLAREPELGLMVGDGLNDAPAFRVAGSKATPALDRPVLPSQSDFFYVGAGSSAVRQVRSVAWALRRVVRSNLFLAGLYNLVALTLCFFAQMTPLLCAVLMPMSSLVLISLSALLMRPRDARIRT